GLPPRKPGPPHDPQCGGISPPLLPPRAAKRLRADPVLRISRRSPSHRGVVTLSARARRESTTSLRGLYRRHADARGLASVSPLRWDHGRRRTIDGTPSPSRPSSTDSHLTPRDRHTGSTPSSLLGPRPVGTRVPAGPPLTV